MKRLLPILLIVLVIMGCGGKIKQAEAPDPLPDPTYTVEQVAAQAGDLTVALVNPEAEDNGKAHVYCSAVWVSPNEILTAAHCVLGVTRHLEQTDPEGAPARDPFETDYRYITQGEVTGVNREPSALHRAVLKGLDRAHDLALLKALLGGMPVHKFAKVADEVPVVGSHIVMVGHPRGLYWSYVEGTVSAVRNTYPILKSGPFIQVNGTVWFGNSGGGAFDSHGHLIGVASFLAPMPNMAMYIHRDSIVRFLLVAGVIK